MQNRINYSQIFAYLVSGSLGILLAVWITSSFIKTSSSQEAVPPPPELPETVQPLVPPDDNSFPPPPPENVNVPPPQPGLNEVTQDVPPPPPDEVLDSGGNPQETVPPQIQQSPSTNVQLEGQKILKDDIDTLMAPYNYDTVNRRDPFKEFRLEVPGGEIVEEGVFVGPLRPLQRFDLDKIIPVAIIWDVESPKAMFVDPTSKVHILGKDERIGRNNGYIAAIREGEIVVIETVKRRGQLSFKTSILKIGSSKN